MAGQQAGLTLEMAKNGSGSAVALGRSAFDTGCWFSGTRKPDAGSAIPAGPLFVAAAGSFPATVQRLRLAPAERIAQGGMSPSLVKRLNRKEKNPAKVGASDADAHGFSVLRSARMDRVGRQRVAAWEAQNLPMAVTIREATAPSAGGGLTGRWSRPQALP